MKHLLSSSLFLLMTCFPSTASDLATFNYAKSDVRDILAYYQKLTGRPIYVALDLVALVTVQTDSSIPRATAIEQIRTTLLERYGIEFRNEEHHILVAWSKDPKYPRRSDSEPTQAERNARPRIRVINPK